MIIRCTRKKERNQQEILLIQISEDKKGFSGTKAVAGAVLTGGIGLLAGTIGSNKIKITCLRCGHVFNPGDRPFVEQEFDQGHFTKFLIVLIIVAAIIVTIAVIIKKS